MAFGLERLQFGLKGVQVKGLQVSCMRIRVYGFRGWAALGMSVPTHTRTLKPSAVHVAYGQYIEPVLLGLFKDSMVGRKVHPSRRDYCAVFYAPLATLKANLELTKDIPCDRGEPSRVLKVGSG